MNPVLDRELRQRLRGRAAWVALTLYLVALGLILRLVYDVVAHSNNGFGVASQAQIASASGRSIYHWLLFVMLALICFIVPGMTAAAIAGERERQTLVPLQITLLSARSIVLGKLLASLAYVVLLVVAALPFLSVSFLLGGVSAAEVAKGVGMLLVVAIAIASLSLACSSTAKRTQTATVTSYGLVGLLVIGTLVAYGAQRAFDRTPNGTTEPTVLLLNPFAATADVVRGRTVGFDLSSPFQPFNDLLESHIFSSVDVGGAGGGPGVAFTVPAPGFSGNVQIRPAIPSQTLPVMPVPLPLPAPVPAAAPTTVVVRSRAAGDVASGSGVRVASAQVSGSSDQPVVGQVQQFPGPLADRAEVAGMPFWFASILSFAVVALLANLIAVRRVTVPGGRAAP